MALITLSQSMGSGGAPIARRVAEALNLDLFDDQRLKQKAVEMGVCAADLKGLDEKAPGFFDRLLSQKPEVYLDILKAVVYETCRQGSGVIVGHGSQVLLNDFNCAFHVLLHASQKARIESIAREKGLAPEVARRLIHKNDSEQRGFFRYAFNLRWDDPTLYDLVINPDKIGLDVSAGIIIQGARSDEIKACSLSALETIERRSLERQVTAALKRHDLHLSLLYVEVPKPGVAMMEIKSD
jgi:cytidylate kinase